MLREKREVRVEAGDTRQETGAVVTPAIDYPFSLVRTLAVERK